MISVWTRRPLRHHVGTVYSDRPDDESAPLNLLVHFLDLDYAEGDAEKGIDLNYKKIIGVSTMKEIDRQKDEVTGALTVKVEGAVDLAKHAPEIKSGLDAINCELCCEIVYTLVPSTQPKKADPVFLPDTPSKEPPEVVEVERSR